MTNIQIPKKKKQKTEVKEKMKSPQMAVLDAQC